jgi:hypothetical protein
MTACILKHGNGRAVPDGRSRSAENDNVNATSPAAALTLKTVTIAGAGAEAGRAGQPRSLAEVEPSESLLGMRSL